MGATAAIKTAHGTYFTVGSDIVSPSYGLTAIKFRPGVSAS